MSELLTRLRQLGGLLHRYLAVARLTPSLRLLLPLAPMLGALMMATGGQPRLTTLFTLLLIVLALWGVGWSFHDLLSARRLQHGRSRILLGVVTEHQTSGVIALLVGVVLATSLLLAWQLLFIIAVVLLVALLYPWLERRSYLIDAWFGLAVACTVLLPYAATAQWPGKGGALLAVVTLLWATGWQVLCNWPRQRQLLGQGVRSLGMMFGDASGYLVIALQLAVLLGAWMAAPQAQLTTPYLLALSAAAVLIGAQSLLIHKRGSSATTAALQLHLLSGAAIWLGIIIHSVSAN